MGAVALEQGLVLLEDHGIDTAPMAFLQLLTHKQPDYGVGIAEHMLQTPDASVSGCLGTILWALRSLDRVPATPLAAHALASGHVGLALSVAFWARVSAQDAQADDLSIIEGVVAHGDARVRRVGVESLVPLGREQPMVAADLALRADIGTDTALASAVCAVFDPDFGIDPEDLEDDDVAAVLDKLGVVDSVDDYHVLKFLAHAATRMPQRVAAMLLARTYDDAESARPGFQPLPYHDLKGMFAGATEHPEYIDMLADVRSRATEDSWRTRFWLPKLYGAASDGFTSGGIASIEEWATSGDPARVRGAARLLSEAPPSFVFDYRDLVIRMLDNAYGLGGDVYDEMATHLGHSSRTGFRSRTLGIEDACPEDVLLRRQAAEALVGLAHGSPVYRFYAGLLALAEENIRDQRLQDEEQFG